MAVVQAFHGAVAVQGKNRHPILVFWEDNLFRSRVAGTETGPITIGDRKYYGLFLKMYDYGAGNYLGPTHYWNISVDQVSGNFDGISVDYMTEANEPFYQFADQIGQAANAEPVTRLSGLSQSNHVYTMSSREVSGTDKRYGIQSWTVSGSNPPVFNWGREVSASLGVSRSNGLYFDNWNTYLYFAFSSSTTLWLRKYNQSGTLIWNRRITLPSALYYLRGDLAGFDLGEVNVPILSDTGTTDFVYNIDVVQYDSGGTPFGIRVWTNEPTSGGFVNRIHQVISSRPAWDAVFLTWTHWENSQNLNQTYLLTLQKGLTVGAGIKIENEDLFTGGGVEDAYRGNAIFAYRPNNAFNIRFISFDRFGDVYWQRKLEFYAIKTVKVTGAATSQLLNIKDLEMTWGQMSRSQNDTFRVFAMLESSIFNDFSANDFEVVIDFPMDGRLIEDPLNLGEKSILVYEDATYEYRLMFIYTESDLAFTTWEPTSTASTFTYATTDGLTNTNTSAPTETVKTFTDVKGTYR